MNSIVVEWTHVLVPALLQPVVIGLFVCVAVACIDVGVLVGERGRLRQLQPPGNIGDVERRAHRRIERADILTRTSPMLGLMATLISLGPGLTALSTGNLNLLAGAMLNAFDATVLGLAAGVVSFIVGRLRRRWYDEALTRWEHQS